MSNESEGHPVVGLQPKNKRYAIRGVRNVTTVVPAGPKNSVGLDRGFNSLAEDLVMVISPLVTDEFDGGILGVSSACRGFGCGLDWLLMDDREKRDMTMMIF